MGRLLLATSLICVLLWLLVLVGHDVESEAAVCGVPPPTSTPGPPTATQVPPTASPPLPPPTVDLGSLPHAAAPAGLHAIAACDTDDQVRATLRVLVDLLLEEGWERSPFNPGLPPGVRLGMFVDPADSRRTIGVGVLGDDSPLEKAGVAHGIARGYLEGSELGASIATDGVLVWTRYERDGHSYLDWGAVDGTYRHTIWASDPADLGPLLDTYARAAEHACYPDCR